MDEVLAALFAVVIGLVYFPKVSNAVAAQAHTMRDVTTARQQQLWVSAVTNYVNANLATLESSTGGTPAPITSNVMSTSGLGLPTGFTGKNPFNQTWQAAISQPTAGNLQVLIYATGGDVISDQELGLIARAANGAGGLIPSNNSGIYSGASQNAYGAFGAWKISTSGYSVGAAGGSPATLLMFSNGGLQSNYLYRNAIPGQAQLNDMNTALGMNGNNITNVGQLQANAGNGVQIGSSLFYGDTANSAIRQNGALFVQNQAGTAAAPINTGTASVSGDVNASGSFNAAGNVTAGGSASISGNITAGGVIQGGLLFSTGNAQVNGSIQVNGNTNTSGNVNVGGYVVVNGAASPGAGCPGPQYIGQGPTGPLLCESGVWTASAQFNPKVYASVNGDSGTIGPYNWCFMMDATVTDTSAFGSVGVTLIADGGAGNRFFNVHNSHAGVTNPIIYACF